MSKPKRVLHFFGRMNRGGAETFIMNVYRNIDRSKIQFDFAVTSPESGHYDDEIKQLGGNIYILPIPSESGLLKYRKALINLIKQNGPFHGFHSHVHHFSGWNLKIAHELNIPLRIAHSHSVSDGKKDSFLRNLYRSYMIKLIDRHATHKLTCSESAGISLFGEKITIDQRYKVIKNAFDLSPFAEVANKTKEDLRMKIGMPLNKRLIGHIGRFVPQKNHDLLIDIFYKVAEIDSNVDLVLVGDGELREKILNKVENLSLKDRVHFLRVRSDIPEIMCALDLFVFPSLYEGLGIVLVEAQAAGLPCIVSNTITKEVDLGLNLIHFVELSDFNGWVSNILKISTEKTDWEERKNIIQLKGYDIKEVSKEIQYIYENSENELSETLYWSE